MSTQIAERKQEKLSVPRWARQLAGGGRPAFRRHDAFDISTLEGEHATLISIRLPAAKELDADTFELQVAEIYDRIRLELHSRRHGCAVRFWNLLPAIHQQMDPARDRYMVFNAGRFAAMGKWFGQSEKLLPLFPAASGIGHTGNDLVVHCLSLSRGGVNIENPRQIPAFRYSSRYGPRPPCFARGTLISHPSHHRPALLVAGTASIRGEQSVHVGQLPEQIRETLENLRELLRAAGESPDGDASLAFFTDIRIYYLRSGDRAEIESEARKIFSPETRVEMIRADLCRADLLVEIEGIASLSPGARR